MPYSLVINFTPLSPIYTQYLSGRHIHALFLTLVSSVDKELGDYLHESSADKAFTLSPLQVSNYSKYKLIWEHQKNIPAGMSCWLRVSLLDDKLFSKLTQLWLNLNPDKPWHLGPANLKIIGIQGTPQSNQPWANNCSYAQLYEEASEDNCLLSFQVATPTTFRQGKRDTALPTAETVFNSLYKRWQKYSGIEFNDLPIEVIFPSYFDIHTEIVADSRSKIIGCVGNISYRILGDVKPIQIKQINTLADYAFYSGIGRKTTMGMGMIRREVRR